MAVTVSVHNPESYRAERDYSGDRVTVSGDQMCASIHDVTFEQIVEVMPLSPDVMFVPSDFGDFYTLCFTVAGIRFTYYCRDLGLLWEAAGGQAVPLAA